MKTVVKSGVKTVDIKDKDKDKDIKENNKKEIVKIYNAICTNLPQVQKITEKREKAIDKLLKEFSIEKFEEICKKANASDFLTGNNDRKWKADFDFLMRTDKALSVLEGKYSQNKPKSSEPKKEEFVAIDTSDLTPEEYSKLVRGEITTKQLIEEGRIHV